VGSRLEPENQILSERITGTVGRSISTKIETVTWLDESIGEKLGALVERYPGAQVYLTGAIEVDAGEVGEVCGEAAPVGDGGTPWE
jgi:hypothetical protein